MIEALLDRLHGGATLSALLSFQREGTVLGPQLILDWKAGSGGFPEIPGAAAFTVPGGALSRPGTLNASLELTRFTPLPNSEDAAYLQAFPVNDQPALFRATLTFHDLIGAGASRPVASNPFAVSWQGRLSLQPVTYLPTPP